LYVDCGCSDSIVGDTINSGFWLARFVASLTYMVNEIYATKVIPESLLRVVKEACIFFVKFLPDN